MENDEKTKELGNLSELIENEELTNKIDDVKELSAEISTIEETVKSIDELSDKINDKQKKDNIFKKIKNKWKNLSKKRKRLIIIFGILLLICLSTLIVLLVKNFKKNDETKIKEDIVLEADNYRYENGTLIFLDSDSKELGKYECKNKDEKLCYVSYVENDENLDISKKVTEDNEILPIRSSILLNNYVYVNDSKKDDEIFLINIKESDVIEEFTAVKTYSQILNYAIVKDYTGSYGLVSFNEEGYTKLFDLTYDYLAINTEDKSENKYIIASKDGRNYLLDYEENIISKAINEQIVNYNNNFIVTKNNDFYHLYDYKNNKVINKDFKYIKLFDDFVTLVDDNGLSFIDNKKNKLNEVPVSFKLNQQYYQKTYVFDKNKKVIETLAPFKIENNESTISIDIDGKITVINKEEGRISATLDFLNYFDSNLYIYNDEAKETLIGTYKCSNPNVITKDSTTLENCYMASDASHADNDMSSVNSTGIIPIINNKYAFIVDNPAAVTQETNNVVLYDLQAKKTLSKYINVDTNLNTNMNSVSFANNVNVKVIAKNKSNNYGIFMLDDNGISSLAKFEYSDIEIIGDNYLVSNANGYNMINKSGDLITKSVKSKIRGYNSKYIKVLDNSSYYVYDYEGVKITNKGYKYIELYNNYFVAIDAANKLDIFEYANPNASVISETVALHSDSYYNTDKPAFKVEFNTSSALISVLNNGEYVTGVHQLIANIY